MDTASMLMQRAHRDHELLARNERRGDDLAKARHVDFAMVADAEASAKRVCDFVNACNYGLAWFQREEDDWKLYVRVLMPLARDRLCCTSGLMAVIAAQFGLRYEGWACFLMTD
jgi:hypothetical protein